MLRNLMASAAAACLLAGCTGTLYKNATELQAEPTLNVALAHGDSRVYPMGNTKKFETELDRREAFSPQQWEKIKAGKIGIGDPQELVAAAWGRPSRITTHTEVDNSGELWYYKGDTFQPHGVVILRGGRVASITQ